jgi:hypothetical protein
MTLFWIVFFLLISRPKTVLGADRHGTDWQELREINQELRRRERLGIDSNSIFTRRRIEWFR